MSVGENIAVTPSLLGWPGPRIDQRIAALLDLVELPRDYAKRRPDQLSGGQRQRVGLARALAAEPLIMLLDEPFGALDAVTRVTLGDAYRAIHDKLRTTTIMVTHDMQEALLLADRVLVMHQGKIVDDETPRALMSGAKEGEAARLMDMPRKQAERLRQLMEGESGAL
jgi:osmoprotectant transport system ATP-binding protein